MAIPLTSPDLSRLGVGTVGWRAPVRNLDEQSLPIVTILTQKQESSIYAADHPQVAHGHAISHAADVWVLGRVMLAMMNLERNPAEHQFGSVPDMPAFAVGIEAYYPLELTVLVQACLVTDPNQRPSIGALWRNIHLEVASFVGLTGAAKKTLNGDGTEILQYKDDVYLAFAPPLP